MPDGPLTPKCISKQIDCLYLPGEEQDKIQRLANTRPKNRTCTIPFSRNRQFLDCDNTLRRLDRVFQSADAVDRRNIVLLQGITGTSKTETALEYAWSRARLYDVVLWVSARNEYSILRDLGRAARNALGLPDACSKFDEKNAVLVMKWLEVTASKWLLIYDNVDRDLIFEKYMPESNHGSVLVVTTKPEFASYADVHIEKPGLNPTQGARLFSQIYQRRITSDRDQRLIVKISELMRGAPQFISQAAALTRETGLGFQQFLDDHRTYLRMRRNARETSMNVPVLHMSYRNWNEAAVELSLYLGFYMAESVPRELLEGLWSNVGLARRYSLDDALYCLEKMELLKTNTETNTIFYRRAVQKYYRLLSQASPNYQNCYERVVRSILVKLQLPDKELVRDRYVPQALEVSYFYYNALEQDQDYKVNPCADLVTLISYTLQHPLPHNMKRHQDLEAVGCCAYYATRDDHPAPAHAVFGLLEAKGIEQLRIGESSDAVMYLRDARQHLRSTDPVTLQLKIICLWRLGIAFGTGPSESGYEEAMRRFLAADALFHGNKWRFGLAGVFQWIAIQTSMGKLNYLHAKFVDAASRLDQACEAITLANERIEQIRSPEQKAAKRIKLLAHNVVLHLSYVSLKIRSSRLQGANQHLEWAAESLKLLSNWNYSLELNSQYYYWAGRLRLKEGRIQESIEYTGKAYYLDKVKREPNESRARSMYAYARAYKAEGRDEEKWTRLERNAIRAARVDLARHTDESAWTVFDDMVSLEKL